MRVGSRRFGDVAIRPRTTDISVVGEVLAGAYDAAAEAIDDGELIVDLGAHIGLVAKTLKRTHPQLAMVAVEANPDNVWLLERNAPFATVIPRPVAANNRRVRLTGERLDGFRIEDGGDAETITMDEIEGEIALLKVDIEGTEEELFESCSTWIGRVHAVVCECHHPYRARDLIEAVEKTGRAVDVVALLEHERFGYDLVTLSLH